VANSGIAARQFGRFVVVGIVNTAFSYSCYAALIYADLHYSIASLLASILGILFSFTTQSRFVFDNSDGRLIGRYAIAWGVIYLLNVALIKGFLVLGANSYLGGALALPFVVVASYLVQRHAVFARRG
jgi:putative flippase GtrA